MATDTDMELGPSGHARPDDEPEAPDSSLTPDTPLEDQPPAGGSGGVPPSGEDPEGGVPPASMPGPERPPPRPGKGAKRMKVSAAGVTLIKEFEGFPHGGRPYRDIVGVWTIGYGHTEGVGAGSHQITQKQASELLRHDLDDKYGPPVNGLGVPFGQHQFDAIVSFVYNCGPGAVGSGTGVGRALRAQRWQAAADGLLAWNKAGGAPIAGLTRRRKAERAMFLAVDDPYEGYTDTEKRWIREYDRLVREKADRPRRTALRKAMTAQRTKIWNSAQPKSAGGDGHGWEYKHRRARHASLKARTD